MKSLFIIILLSQLCLASIHCQTIIGTTLRIGSGGVLYLYDYKKNAIVSSFHRDGWGVSNEHIKVSPAGDYIGIILEHQRKQDEQGDFYVPTNLVVLNALGTIVMEIPDVIRYVWSPNNDEIAYVRARGEEGNYTKMPKTLCVVNLKTKKNSIYSQSGYADITWAAHDTMIYYTNYSHIYRVDPKTGESEETSYEGIYFSDDGKYYFTKCYEGSPFRIYDRTTGMVMRPEGANDSLGVSFSQWLPGTHVVVFGFMYREKIIYDMDAKRQLSTFDGIFLGSGHNNVYYLRDKFYFPELKQSKIEKMKIVQ